MADQGELLLENLTSEQLIQQIKDKLKENKAISKKLEKLTEKYVSTYKEYKLLAKDRETLYQSISFALSDEQQKFEQKPLGAFEQNLIIELFKQKDEDRSRALTNLIKETNNEKFLLEEKYRQMVEKQSQNSDQKTQQVIKQLKQQISELDSNNTRLAKEIIELNDIIQIKNSQIQKLNQIEEDYANLKTQNMMQELQFQQPDRLNKIYYSDQMNEQLKMKQQIDKLLEEIQIQNQKIKDLEYTQLQQQQQQVYQTPTPDYDQMNPFEQENTLIKNNLSQDNEKVLKSTQITQTDFQSSDENQNKANFEYLRNVVYKYFLYQETRNYKEASILMNAIMTVLKMSNEERKRIDQARERGFMKSAKNLISDSFMCLKQPQLNDMNFERPRSRVEQMNKHMMN